VGTIQPIREIAKMVRQERTKRMSFLEVGPPELFFHCDASQAMHLEIDVEQLGVDLLTLDSSKFYGPRGIGMLYIKKDTAIKPVLFGGGQEGGMRSGTENIPAIRGFAKALDICDEEREREFKRLTGLRQQLIEGLKRPANIDFLRRLKSPAPIATVSCLTGGGKIRAIVAPAQSALTDAKNQYSLVSQNVISININGNDAKVSPHIINISIPGIDNEFFTLWLDARGISCSTRSACLHDGDESYVLKAMKADSSSSVRFSIGRWTKKGDITKLCKLISTFLLNNDPTKLKLGNQNA